MKIGIVGHGADKFTEKSKQKAIDIIAYINILSIFIEPVFSI